MILPNSGRGANFDNFRIIDYLNLADIALCSLQDWEDFNAGLKLKPDKILKNGAKRTIGFPALDVDYLKIRTPDGHMDIARTTELFKVVIACWEGKKPIGFVPGLIAEFWRTGTGAAEIINALEKSTDKEGNFSFKLFDQYAKKRTIRAMGLLNLLRSQQKIH